LYRKILVTGQRAGKRVTNKCYGIEVPIGNINKSAWIKFTSMGRNESEYR